MGETDSSFQEFGDAMATELERHAAMRGDSSVLDIGCGYGRLPHALLRRGFEGRYLGFDILAPQIRWCRRALGSERVEFRHLDLRNDRYNPRGGGSVADLDLGGERFDVIALFSVFTHVWPEDVRAYLELFGSALLPGGRVFATFFLLDDEWRARDAAGQGGIRFPHRRAEGCRYAREESPLHQVGYELEWVLGTAGDAGLAPARDPLFGTWSGRPASLEGLAGYQDAVVLELASAGSVPAGG